MRISGLSSGFDVEQIVEDLMRVERIPVDRVFQQKVQAEWQRDAYRDVNLKLLRLRNMSFDLGLQGTFDKKTAFSSDENIISVSATGAAQEGHYQYRVEQLAASAQLVAADAEDGLARFFAENDLTEAVFELRGLDGNYETIEVSLADNLEDLAGQINRNDNLGINAFADSGGISLTTVATGEQALIAVNDPDGVFEFVFSATPDENGVVASGSNARLNVSGLTIERSSNEFEINGINVVLRQAAEGQEVSVQVRRDVEEAVGRVKGFVDLYNELIDELNSSLREDVYRDFPPLTDAQKAGMTDKEIELWEEKAKSGLLRSDRIVGNVLSEMRLALGGAVEDLEYGTLADIGIKTGAWFEHGHLHLDEDKLRGALEENPGAVRALFTNQSEKVGEQGLAKRLTTVLDLGMQRITDTAGKAANFYDQSFLGERIRDYEDRLSILEERLIRVEQNHWDKFTVMEKVLNQLYAQSDWLFQQLAGLQG